MMKSSLTGFIWAMAVVAGLICLPAAAQQRRPNFGAQTFLHIWPVSGVWEAAMIRFAPEGSLGCVVLTGYHNAQTGERYFWGFRRRGEQAALDIIDSNSGAVDGPAIKVIIDGAVVGSFPINVRRDASGFHVIRSDLTPKDARAVENLMSIAGSMEFVTGTATYSASLAGARQAMQNFYACLVEANQINSAQSQ